MIVLLVLMIHMRFVFLQKTSEKSVLKRVSLNEFRSWALTFDVLSFKCA